MVGLLKYTIGVSFRVSKNISTFLKLSQQKHSIATYSTNFTRKQAGSTLANIKWTSFEKKNNKSAIPWFKHKKKRSAGPPDNYIFGFANRQIEKAPLKWNAFSVLKLQCLNHAKCSSAPPQIFGRIQSSGPNRLIADCSQRNQNGQDTGQRKDAPPQVDSEAKISQPGLHSVPGNGQTDN